MKIVSLDMHPSRIQALIEDLEQAVDNAADGVLTHVEIIGALEYVKLRYYECMDEE